MAKGRPRFGKCGKSYNLEEIWADPEEIGGAIRKIEKNYPALNKKLFIITEGPYDYEFYSRFFNPRLCEIRIANSKKNVISIIGEMCKSPGGKASESVIGIIDRDFSALVDEDIPDFENLFMTDTHDIETMILSEDLVESVVRHYERFSAGGAFQRKYLSGIRNRSLFESLINCSLPLGLSLLINEKYGLNMSFKHISCKKRNRFLDFIDPQTLSCDEEAVYSYVIEKNPEKSELFRDALLKEKMNSGYSDVPMQICRGHDLMCVLLLELNTHYPGMNNERIRSRDLERAFRNMYDADRFFRTNLCSSIKKWAGDKHPEIFPALFTLNRNL
ncbi:DUF4435 domain-containing protein [Methanoplanus sp. FWC-SCC4]|uniref:DUF4435 domain-containing protein n=1 Tax=Methanochimaera problematica TaxID=2609417 RepID=A0AA97FF95_9EURY|nr:DUF4435 domain-containing protein [Methanoplanus sp. FWC-SCC4]WOF17223.1 DUF4435 domain-containing protein [Methanoplanus sp. FWC-SCC4]